MVPDMSPEEFRQVAVEVSDEDGRPLFRSVLVLEDRAISLADVLTR
jgi:hypothetical protein